VYVDSSDEEVLADGLFEEGDYGQAGVKEAV
jgi:hypothetical protein